MKTLEEYFGFTPEFLAEMERQDKRLEELRQALRCLKGGKWKSFS